jgi:uncharacterized coiled-coil DUF342 family protein
MSLDEALKKLRYVKRWPDPESEIRASDVLTKLESLRALRDALKTKAVEFGCPCEKIDALTDQLDSILAMIRYVKIGDIVEPEDHNYMVDALKKARDILSEIESFCTGLKDQLEECQTALMECQSKLEECLARPPFKTFKVSATEVTTSKPKKTFKVSATEVTTSKFAKSISIG